MNRNKLIVFLLPLALAACAEERTVVHDNSAGAKFSSLFSSDARWQVSDGSDPAPAQVDKDGRPVIVQDAPGNFSGYHIVTSFQTDTPQSAAPGQPNANGQTPLSGPPIDPWVVPQTRPSTPAGH